MSKFVIDGSHFGGVLQAVAEVAYTHHRVIDTELVCDHDEEIYILRETAGKYVIATIPY